MRVLIVSAPLLGHLLPMVPLAEALHVAGHEVTIVAGGDAMSVRPRGIPVENAAPDLHIGRLFAPVLLRHPVLGLAEIDGRAGTRVVSILFERLTKRILPAITRIAERFRPELVVHEPLAISGALVAARLGVPAVLQENSLYDGRELISATASRLGVEPSLEHVITIAPSSVVGDRPGWPMSGVPDPGLGELPSWLHEPAHRPRVLVSRTTVAGPGGGQLMTAVVRAAGSVDADFVLVRPDRAVLRRPLPANVRTTDWLPINQALATATAIVHHGGAGSVLGALAAGVPQLAVPGMGDRRYNAGRVADRGAGLALSERDITPAALTRLISDPDLTRAAQEVRREMHDRPAPAELVDRLAALA